MYKYNPNCKSALFYHTFSLTCHCERPTGARQSRKPAFSLVEMLMALLVASLLMTALAPVMTRRLNNENISFNTMTGSKNIPSYAFTNDTVSDITIDNACKIPEDIFSMSTIIASGGGGGGGAVGKTYDSIGDKTTAYNETEGKITTTEVYGEVGQNVSKTFTIDSTMSDIWIELLGGGGAGGDGAGSGGRYPNEDDCGQWGVYMPPEYNCTNVNDISKITTKELVEKCHSTCVSKYNPGQQFYYSYLNAGSPDTERTQAGVKYAAVRTECPTSSSYNCCWYSPTNGDAQATADTLKTAGTSCTFNKYSGCLRTLCQWDAANTICSNWKPDGAYTNARLPKRNEFVGWSKQHGIGAIKADLCANTNAVSGISLCPATGQGACRGNSSQGMCWPNSIWAQEEDGNRARAFSYARGGVGDTFYDTGGAGGDGYSGKSYAYSVRCVVDKIANSKGAKDFVGYRGGGGSSGAFLRIKIPDEVLNRAFTNDDGTQYTGTLKLTLSAGHGGDKNENSVKRVGGASSVSLIKPGKGQLWYVNIPNHAGWNSSINATATEHGSAGWPTDNYCSYKNNIYEEKDKITLKSCDYYGCGNDCRNILGVTIGRYGGQGADGGAGASSPQGWGGTIHPVTTVQTKGGTENNVYGEDAQDASRMNPGAGGAGGFCIEGPTRDNPICGKGGNGAGGAARFTYKKTYPGAGGGGGGAGTLLHIKNIPVNPDTLIKVQVGGQGAGGVQNGHGQKGGNSFIEITNGSNTTKYEVIGGSGGKIGTQANLSTSPVTYAKGGKGGSLGEVSNETLNKLNAQNLHIEYYPNTEDDKNLAKGNNAPDSSSNIPYISSGGNGGINTKISSLAGVAGIPCGGYSNTKIKINNKDYVCGGDDIPTRTFDAIPLTRTLLSSIIEQSISNYIKTYAPASTGGGGGGWSINSSDGTENTGKGANGMGGYVILYFQ